MASVRTERVDACPLCGEPTGRAYCRARDRQHGVTAQIFTFARCHRCRIVYQSHRPIEADVALLYPEAYEPHHAGAAPSTAPAPPATRRIARPWLTSLERLNDALRRRRPDPLPSALAALADPPREGATVLDFGCGSAAFLDGAATRGWATVGFDVAPGVVAAVARAGHRAFADDRLWLDVPDASLDLVRMNHVIEHLYDPRATLARLHRKLRPGGCLHVATPNAASAAFRVLRGRWFPLECPRHVVLYTRRALTDLLRTVGFASIEGHDEVLTKDLARSIGYLLADFGAIDGRTVPELVNRPLLGAVLFTPTRLAASFGAADRFHLIARA